MSWPKNPLIYEINTWIWLQELSGRYNRRVTLANIPAQEYDHLAHAGYDAVWLMGVWERSPVGIAIARYHTIISKELKKALPDYTDSDLVGSPYCIRRYRVEAQLGGNKGLTIARRELARRGIRLILDFVPNHVAPDHPWTMDHPEYFIGGTEKELSDHPEDYLESNNSIFARARDPFFPPWPDVLQLNVFHPGLREALEATIREIAGMCDGVRCDMAMLDTNEIFLKTWGKKAGPVPEESIWKLLVSEAVNVHSGFIFIGEVYWDMEWEMMQEGFHYCYDKRLYDRLLEGTPENVRQHLTADVSYQSRLLRFLENHDEPRAATIEPIDRHMTLALAALTLPGIRLLHDGQRDGRKVKVPVFLGRRQHEVANDEISRSYERLINLLKSEVIRNGEWSLCEATGWPENQSYRNILAWEWVNEEVRALIIVNMSDEPAQCHIRPGRPYDPGHAYQLFDALSGELYTRDGNEMNAPGLFAGLQPWGAHTFIIEH